MIDSEKLLVTLPHFPLGGEEFFRRNFVGNLVVGGNVTHPIDGFRKTARGAADQATTLSGISFARVGNDVEHVSLSKGDQDVV